MKKHVHAMYSDAKCTGDWGWLAWPKPTGLLEHIMA